ncbi:MAG: hypothetical protein COA79_09120 [Planctomycetota bacterium]|nr:MAG: hypothetical protein COA79_09120 [Planctomycetota bacterium]
MSTDEALGGILVATTADKIKADYFAANQKHATFLPPERLLTKQYKVSRSTMRRALALLTRRNLVRAEHGRGYRILEKGETSKKIPRIAILQAAEKSAIHHGRTSQEIIDAMQRQSLKRKWQVLNIDIGDINPQAVIADLKDAGIQAVALVFEDRKIVEALLKANIPCISLENSGRELNIDYIFQDNYGGARRATKYLLSRQHQRIAWVGPINDSYTSFARWSGARSALIEIGIDFLEDDVITEFEKLESVLKKLLSKKNRPKAVLALWESQIIALINVTKKLKLKIGKDIDIIGWSNQTRYQALKRDIFTKGKMPPMVVWNPDEMAEVAITRLIAHFENSNINPLHIAVPAKLVLPK